MSVVVSEGRGRLALCSFSDMVERLTGLAGEPLQMENGVITESGGTTAPSSMTQQDRMTVLSP